MPTSIDLMANLSSAEIKGAITDADSRVREAIEALAKAYDATIHAAILCGVVYFQAPIGRGGRRVSGTLDEVAALLKGRRWAGTGTFLRLPSLQQKEQLTRFAMAGLVFQQGGVILTGKTTGKTVGLLDGNDEHPGVLSLINKAKNANMDNESIMDAIIGNVDAQAAYDSLKRAVSQAQSVKADKADKVKPEATETTETAKVTTDADLVASVLSILNGWKFDGTANIDMVFDKVAEIAAMAMPATVMA
jgi:hypothetical protein